ncbi:MAG TPA: cyclopropane-fatty-acyl-phospholipid synthase family protein [Terracidiphilus sp.]|nr:cyclopropane-fatty-acyl-phospholipid synthase family protein [Terracidiphilus sp.]
MFPSNHAQRTKTLNSLFANYEGPAFSIRFWDGWSWSEGIDGAPACTLVVRNPQALHVLAAEPNEAALGDAFVCGDLDVEGDIFSVFSVGEHIFNREHSLRQKVLETMMQTSLEAARWIQSGQRNSMRRDKASIAYHYDQPFEFYRPWLGKSLAYSSAYFHSEKETLDEAQEHKLELICRKLRLQAKEEFLDIGCGWGSLLLHAVCRHDAHAHGITLSKEQEAVVKRRIGAAGFEQQCTVELRDYRTLENAGLHFDKIASVGMIEHVGLKNLPHYFRIAESLLNPGGVFLNQGIARAAVAPVREASFIDKYVFPDGRLVTLNEVLHAAEDQGLEVRDVENLREHYAMTLRRWVEGLQAHRDTLLKHVSEETYRIWLLYMAGSSAAFGRGDIAAYQVLFRRCREAKQTMPLTRENWLAPAMPKEEEVHA